MDAGTIRIQALFVDDVFKFSNYNKNNELEWCTSINREETLCIDDMIVPYINLEDLVSDF